MRTGLIGLMLLAPWLFPHNATAQYTKVYVFGAPTGWTQDRQTTVTADFGAGVERLIGRGVGVGADIQGVSPGKGRQNAAEGVVSLNGFYHFRPGGRLDPFATAGYSRPVPYPGGGLLNCGGGVNYWYMRRGGLQVEFREFLRGRSLTIPFHLTALRFGLFFRL
jgi:hypothetical protein